MWQSYKQRASTTCSNEAELLALSDALKQSQWAKMLMEDLGFTQTSLTLYEDNQAVINQVKNPSMKTRTRQ
jgi:ribonuclease HI